MDTPIDTFVTWIHWNVQLNDTCQQEQAVAAARQAVRATAKKHPKWAKLCLVLQGDRRSNLLGENDEKLLFLAYNIRVFQFNYWQKINVSVSLYHIWLILDTKCMDLTLGYITYYSIDRTLK